MDTYLRRRFPDRIRDRLLLRPNPRRERAAALVEPIGSLRFRPLLLAHVEAIIDVGGEFIDTAPPRPDETWTDCRLYGALVDAWLLREQRKGVGRIGDSASAAPIDTPLPSNRPAPRYRPAKTPTLGITPASVRCLSGLQRIGS